MDLENIEKNNTKQRENRIYHQSQERDSIRS